MGVNSNLPEILPLQSSDEVEDIQSSSLTAAMRTERGLMLGLGATGALLALLAPWVSCAVQYGDRLTEYLSLASHPGVQCFANDETVADGGVSISNIISTPIGAACFATGVACFYPLYTICIARLIKLQPNKQHEMQMLLLLVMEVMLALGCSACPIIDDTSEAVHFILFIALVVIGCLGAILHRCYIGRVVADVKDLLVFRAAVMCTLAAALLGCFLFSPSLPFRVLQYNFMLAHFGFGTFLIHEVPLLIEKLNTFMACPISVSRNLKIFIVANCIYTNNVIT